VAHGTATLSNDLLKISSDRVGEPTEDDSVHPSPHMIIDESVIGQDVVDETYRVRAINICSCHMA
jgi:hypothetical protein